MSYINVGAKTNGEGLPLAIKTKKALRELLSQDPHSVTFYSTSPMGPQHHGTVARLTPGDVLTVCGPDPQTDRKWWTNIKIDASGNVFMDDKKIKPVTT